MRCQTHFEVIFLLFNLYELVKISDKLSQRTWKHGTHPTYTFLWIYAKYEKILIRLCLLFCFSTTWKMTAFSEQMGHKSFYGHFQHDMNWLKKRDFVAFLWLLFLEKVNMTLTLNTNTKMQIPLIPFLRISLTKIEFFTVNRKCEYKNCCRSFNYQFYNYRENSAVFHVTRKIVFFLYNNFMPIEITYWIILIFFFTFFFYRSGQNNHIIRPITK